MRIVKIFFILLITIICSFFVSEAAYTKEFNLYGFEKDPQGWEIPDWAFEKPDHVARQLGISEFQASEGKYALQVDTNFTGGTSWEGAYVERVVDVSDWSPFKYLSIDVYLPKDAPRGLRAKIILSVGEDWKWTEANKGAPLTPGEWVVLKVDLTSNSANWRRFIDDSFRADIKKVGVRVESYGKIRYQGPIYLDNVKLSD